MPSGHNPSPSNVNKHGIIIYRCNIMLPHREWNQAVPCNVSKPIWPCLSLHKGMSYGVYQYDKN